MYRPPDGTPEDIKRQRAAFELFLGRFANKQEHPLWPGMYRSPHIESQWRAWLDGAKFGRLNPTSEGTV